MSQPDELPIVLFKTPDEFAAWLDTHADAPGLWLQMAKKGSGEESISYDDALDVAICYGWVDSMVHRLDDKFYLTKFTLRRPGSNWTLGNQAKAEALISSGLMKPSGLKTVDLAKQNGKWQKPD